MNPRKLIYIQLFTASVSLMRPEQAPRGPAPPPRGGKFSQPTHPPQLTTHPGGASDNGRTARGRPRPSFPRKTRTPGRRRPWPGARRRPSAGAMWPLHCRCCVVALAPLQPANPNCVHAVQANSHRPLRRRRALSRFHSCGFRGADGCGQLCSRCRNASPKSRRPCQGHRLVRSRSCVPIGNGGCRRSALSGFFRPAGLRKRGDDRNTLVGQFARLVARLSPPDGLCVCRWLLLARLQPALRDTEDPLCMVGREDRGQRRTRCPTDRATPRARLAGRPYWELGIC